MVVITTKPPPLYKLIIGALFFTVGFFILCVAISTISSSMEEEVIVERWTYIHALGICIIGGVGFSIKTIMYFDLDKNAFKNEYSIGAIKYGKWQKLPRLKYVSLFTNVTGLIEVKLWYGKNEHFSIFTSPHKNVALKSAFQIADRLNLDLFDATDRHHRFYHNMEELKKTFNANSSELTQKKLT